MESINVTTADGVELELNENIIKSSKFITGMLDDDFDESAIIPIMVDKSILMEVMTFCDYYIDKDLKFKVLSDNHIDSYLDNWTIDFLERNSYRIIKLLMAANYLHIDKLIQLLSAKIAHTISTNSAGKIRKLYDFPEKPEHNKITNNIDWIDDN